MIRLATLATAAALMLTACAQGTTTDASADPATPKDFCHAMATAALLAPAATTALDSLFTTMDAMASGSTDGDIETLHTVGTETTSSSESYAAALGTAAGLATDETLAADIASLQEYWTLYVVGLGQIAETATTYGNLVDQTTALTTSDTATTLIADQPATQQRINDSYLAECAG